MKRYEYIYLDDKPTKETILEEASNYERSFFESKYSDLEFVAEDILEAKYNEWEIWDEDESVYLAIRELGSEHWECYEVTVGYRITFSADEVFLDD